MFDIKTVRLGSPVFPYPANHHGDASNNSAFNLINNPELISEIQEVSNMPHAQKIIAAINSPGGQFFTAGCGFYPNGNIFIGYLEFCFRDAEKCLDMNCYNQLFKGFWDWISNDPATAGNSSYILQCYTPSASLFHAPAFEIEQGLRINLDLGGHDLAEIERLLGYFFAFALNDSSLFYDDL